MTEPISGPDEPLHHPTGRGLAATVAPEGVAAGLAIVVVALLLTVRLAGLGSSGPAATARPTEGATPAPTTAGPSVDLVSIRLVLGVDRLLQDSGASLQVELDKPKVDTSNVQATLVQMSQQLNLAGTPAAARLRDAPPTALVGADLVAVYAQLSTEIDEANDFKRNDEPSSRASAGAIVKTLKDLVPIDVRLGQMQAGLPDPAAPTSSAVPPSSAPTDSGGPSASPVTTAPPTASPTIPPTASPTIRPTAPPSGAPTPSSTPPPAEPNQLQNPGFESTTNPWNLVVNQNVAAAAVTLDATSLHGGKTSARIDITASDGNPQSVTIQQTGVVLEQGANYRISIALRSTTDRVVRIRVAPATPQEPNLLSRNFSAGAAWSFQTIDLGTAVGGTGLVFTIDLGSATGSVWIDDVSFARVSPLAP